MNATKANFWDLCDVKHVVKDNAKFCELVDKGHGRRLVEPRKPAEGIAGELVEVIAVIDGDTVYCAYCWPLVLACVWAAKKSI